MKIQIWSDFVCRFCYIGKRKLEKAIDQFPHNEHIQINYKSYQLDPTAKHIPGKEYTETFAQLKNIPTEQVVAINNQLTEQASLVGLTYHFDEMQYSNTFDAHQLAKYAAEQGKEKEITERLLYAYFTESKLISDHKTLIELAKEIGLNAEDVERVLQEDAYSNNMQQDIKEAHRIGVQGVPFFVFNNKFAVSGAQPIETFTNVLQKVWEEENKK